MAKQKGDHVEVSGFEAIVINDIDNAYLSNASRVSYAMKDGTKFWIVIPNELIIKREKRD